MGSNGSLLRTGVILALALASGGLAAYSTVRLMGDPPTPLLEVPLDRHTVASIAAVPGGANIALDGDRSFFVDTASNPTNARNIALFYPGKQITLRPSAAVVAETSLDNCSPIVPVPEPDPPPLPLDAYRQLIAAGFSDAELAVSWDLPEGETNPNTTPAVEGIAARFAGILCADPQSRES